MHFDKFNSIVEYQVEHCKAVLVPKGSEYSRNDDRLHQFKRAAEIQRCSPEQACVGMMCKHLTSVLDIADDAARGVFHKRQTLDEKFGDLINYIILLRACIEEGME